MTTALRRFGAWDYGIDVRGSKHSIAELRHRLQATLVAPGSRTLASLTLVNDDKRDVRVPAGARHREVMFRGQWHSAFTWSDGGRRHTHFPGLSTSVILQTRARLATVTGGASGAVAAMWITSAMRAALSESSVKLHAAAVMLGRRGVVVVGPSGAGKTTTALSMSALDRVRFVENDRVLVRRNAERLEMHAWSGHVAATTETLRRADGSLLQLVRATPESWQRNRDQKWVFPLSSVSWLDGGPMHGHIDLVLLPDATATSAAVLRPVGPDELRVVLDEQCYTTLDGNRPSWTGLTRRWTTPRRLAYSITAALAQLPAFHVRPPRNRTEAAQLVRALHVSLGDS